jgi:hypothetical protein
MARQLRILPSLWAMMVRAMWQRIIDEEAPGTKQ